MASEVEKWLLRLDQDQGDKSKSKLEFAIDEWIDFLRVSEILSSQDAEEEVGTTLQRSPQELWQDEEVSMPKRAQKRSRPNFNQTELENEDATDSIDGDLPATRPMRAHKRQKTSGHTKPLRNALVKLADTVDRSSRIMVQQGDFETLAKTIKDLEDTVERRLGDMAANQLLTPPNHYAPDQQEERYKVAQQWQGLKSKVAKKRDLSQWLEDWTTTYLEAVRLHIFGFTEDSVDPARDFLITIKDAYPRFYHAHIVLVPSAQSGIYFFLRLINDFLKEEVVDGSRMSEKCICGTHNKWNWRNACWYLNESARPPRWTPNPMIMNRLHEMANRDRSLKAFIKKHKKRPDQPPPSLTMRTPSPAPHIKSETDPLAGSFVLNIGASSNICNNRYRFINFTPLDASLPENRIKTAQGLVGAHGIGDVEIFLTTPSGEEKRLPMTIRDAKYCPESPMSLVCVRALSSSGYYFDAGSETLYTININSHPCDYAKVGSHNDQYVLEYNQV